MVRPRENTILRRSDCSRRAFPAIRRIGRMESAFVPRVSDMRLPVRLGCRIRTIGAYCLANSLTHGNYFNHRLLLDFGAHLAIRGRSQPRLWRVKRSLASIKGLCILVLGRCDLGNGSSLSMETFAQGECTGKAFSSPAHFPG